MILASCVVKITASATTEMLKLISLARTLFPFPVTQQVLERGQERYQIFCAVCHGLTGDGDGMVVRRGFRKPSSYYDTRLRSAPVGHFFDVMTNGWGAMPSYAQQIPATDRWAIIDNQNAGRAH